MIMVVGGAVGFTQHNIANSYQNFASETLNKTEGKFLSFIVKDKIIRLYNEIIRPIADEWSRAGDLASATELADKNKLSLISNLFLPERKLSIIR